MIQKVKSWIVDRPQFEFVEGDSGYSVRRLSDGVIFKVGHPYIYGNIKAKDGIDVMLFYINFFSSVGRKQLNFRISRSKSGKIEGGGDCDINELIYKKSGVLEIISLIIFK